MNIHKCIPDFPSSDYSVYYGGPVHTNQLFYIHTLGQQIENSLKINESLWWCGDFDQIKRLVRKNLLDRTKIKFFIGSSGWESKQLLREMNQHSWIVASGNTETIMNHNPELMWKKMLQGLGSNFSVMANFPENPQMN